MRASESTVNHKLRFIENWLHWHFQPGMVEAGVRL
jgi:hypothetical protein